MEGWREGGSKGKEGSKDMILTVSANLYCCRDRIKVHRRGWGLVSLWTALRVQRAEFMPGLPQDLSWSPSPTQDASSSTDCIYSS